MRELLRSPTSGKPIHDAVQSFLHEFINILLNKSAARLPKIIHIIAQIWSASAFFRFATTARHSCSTAYKDLADKYPWQFLLSVGCFVLQLKRFNDKYNKFEKKLSSHRIDTSILNQKVSFDVSCTNVASRLLSHFTSHKSLWSIFDNICKQDTRLLKQWT